MKLEIKNYTKIIKGKKILDDVNLICESGKVYGFYGRNGSGKTMLFRAIATLIFPTEGDVLIDDSSIIENGYDLSQMGVLIESAGFYPYLSGYENLMMLYQINHKKHKEYIRGVLKKVGLEDAGNKPFKEYSLGMKQRLNIAQAFMEDQKIIILDEPTNGIDEKGMKVIYELIEEERKKDKLILIASHNKDDLKTLCDEINFVAEGKVSKLEGEISL